MTIDKQYIEHLQNLSELEFTDEELNNFVKDFEGITEFFNQLNSVDTDNTQTKVKVIEMTDLRDDEIFPSLDRNLVLENAPRKDSISFIVPKVVE